MVRTNRPFWSVGRGGEKVHRRRVRRARVALHTVRIMSSGRSLSILFVGDVFVRARASIIGQFLLKISFSRYMSHGRIDSSSDIDDIDPEQELKDVYAAHGLTSSPFLRLMLLD